MRELAGLAGIAACSLFVGGCMATPGGPLPPPTPLPPVVGPGPTPVPPGPGPTPPGPGSCNTAGTSWAIGQPASPSVLERLTFESGARSARVLQPGQPVTMEFNGDRLSVTVDAGNRIAQVNCG